MFIDKALANINDKSSGLVEVFAMSCNLPLTSREEF